MSRKSKCPMLLKKEGGKGACRKKEGKGTNTRMNLRNTHGTITEVYKIEYRSFLQAHQGADLEGGLWKLSYSLSKQFFTGGGEGMVCCVALS
ncbi:hypothetical protein CEXT_5361 [Caerostris extrusa]|uniref:Uncharacterized protein n=1 Tax=Caerostris extrusa TaxID=172846 RepID=A0AAV4S1R9_CAEEX|nr:hypothetical protein CEXT_5361 [Caerostris extrusa]